MTNKPMRLIAIVIMLVSINNVQAVQTVNEDIVNAWPDSRYTVHDDGTVTDTVTGLMWQQCSVGQSGSDCSGGSATTHNWQAALVLAGTDTTAAHNDWRLPNKNELSSIVAYNREDPPINASVFPNTAITGYWSSSPEHSPSGGAWVAYFNNGYVGYGNRSNGRPVRLVRSGQ